MAGHQAWARTRSKRLRRTHKNLGLELLNQIDEAVRVGNGAEHLNILHKLAVERYLELALESVVKIDHDAALLVEGVLVEDVLRGARLRPTRQSLRDHHSLAHAALQVGRILFELSFRVRNAHFS